MTISVIIPTLNAEKYMQPLLERLQSQTVPVEEIIIVDSESTDKTLELAKVFSNVKILSIKRKEFNHGGTRAYAMEQAKGDIVLFLTQDALPTSNDYVEKLIAPFATDEAIAMTSGRQVPRPEASRIETLTRQFNYPETTFVRSKEDLDTLGIKTFFSSDCCAAYKKISYKEIGGFDKNILVNEDMKIAAKFIFAGYKIAYVGNAQVLHSHNYTLVHQFTRNFDIAAFMKMNQDLFADVSATSEGIKMVKWILAKLLKDLHFIDASYFVLECASKLIANKLGTHYNKLSKKNCIRFSLNKNYWETHK